MSVRGARALYEMAASDPLYRDAHYLVADVDLDLRQASAFVPAPLSLAAPARAVVFAAWFPETSFGSVYREAGVFFHVRHGRTPALFCPWMLVDDDVALITGRELLGFPKKLGEIAFRLEDGRVEAEVSRRGARLLTMRGAVRDALSAPPPVLGCQHRNVRTSLGIALPKLVAFAPRETVREVRHVDLAFSIAGSARDPLDAMGLGPLRAARLHRVDLGAGSLPRPVALVSPLWLAGHTLLRAH